jgi:glycine/D-amino acid oxidase-like deaminating enzyme
MKVAVIGAGYVGLTTALSLAYVGHEVVGVDLDTDKVARLNRGELPSTSHMPRRCWPWCGRGSASPPGTRKRSLGQR